MSIFTDDGQNDVALDNARFVVLSRQIPVLYVMLIVNTLLLAATHVGKAPDWLSLYTPAILSSACAIRLVMWSRSRGRAIPPLAISKRLRSTTILAMVLGALFTTWSLSLLQYGGAYERGHVAFFMTVVVLGAYICLTHLPAALVVLSLTAIVPTAIFLCLSGSMVLAAIAINMVLVALAMAYVTFRYYRDFVDLVCAKQSLIERHAESQRLGDENFKLANLDALTGLPNRRRFLAELDEAFANAEMLGEKLALGLVDLDGFKPVNDVYGHATGDRLLRLVADRVTQICGKQALLARLGGDEFGLLIKNPPGDAAAVDLGRRIADALKQPFELPQIKVQIAASVGFAVYPQAAETAEKLFERADYALYNAKETQRGSVALFSAEHERSIREQSNIAQHLRAADLDAELWIAFQPIVDARAGRAIGFEALGRWTSPLVGDVPPETFVRLAERYSMVNALTLTLLKKTLAAAAEWPQYLRVSFNLSTFDLASPDAMQKIIALLRRSPIAVERIDFEITETAVFVDFEHARRSIQSLKELGARVSLDDFGCGYSSLAYVQKLPLDRIKIDRGFVAEIETDKASRQIIKTIVDLCRNMEIPCVAEGVETRAQLDALAALDCHIVQGYYYAQPMAGERVAAYLLRELAALVDTGVAELKVA